MELEGTEGLETYQTKGSVGGPGCSSRLRHSCPELLGLGILVVLGEARNASMITWGKYLADPVCTSSTEVTNKPMA